MMQKMKNMNLTHFFLCLLSGLGTGTALAQNMGDAATGKALFERKCAPCHADAPARPGTQALNIKYRNSEIPAPLEQRSDLSAAYIETVVRNGLFSMAPLRKTEVTDSELADISAYLTQPD